MSARAWLVAIIGTALIVLALPYVLAVFGLAPNGTETLILVVLLWTGGWLLGSRRTSKRAEQ